MFVSNNTIFFDPSPGKNIQGKVAENDDFARLLAMFSTGTDAGNTTTASQMTGEQPRGESAVTFKSGNNSLISLKDISEENSLHAEMVVTYGGEKITLPVTLIMMPANMSGDSISQSSKLQLGIIVEGNQAASALFEAIQAAGQQNTIPGEVIPISDEIEGNDGALLTGNNNINHGLDVTFLLNGYSKQIAVTKDSQSSNIQYVETSNHTAIKDEHGTNDLLFNEPEAVSDSLINLPFEYNPETILSTEMQSDDSKKLRLNIPAESGSTSIQESYNGHSRPEMTVEGLLKLLSGSERISEPINVMIMVTQEPGVEKESSLVQQTMLLPVQDGSLSIEYPEVVMPSSSRELARKSTVKSLFPFDNGGETVQEGQLNGEQAAQENTGYTSLKYSNVNNIRFTMLPSSQDDSVQIGNATKNGLDQTVISGFSMKNQNTCFDGKEGISSIKTAETGNGILWHGELFLSVDGRSLDPVLGTTTSTVTENTDTSFLLKYGETQGLFSDVVAKGIPQNELEVLSPKTVLDINQPPNINTGGDSKSYDSQPAPADIATQVEPQVQLHTNLSSWPQTVLNNGEILPKDSFSFRTAAGKENMLDNTTVKVIRNNGFDAGPIHAGSAPEDMQAPIPSLNTPTSSDTVQNGENIPENSYMNSTKVINSGWPEGDRLEMSLAGKRLDYPEQNDSQNSSGSGKYVMSDDETDISSMKQWMVNDNGYTEPGGKTSTATNEKSMFFQQYPTGKAPDFNPQSENCDNAIINKKIDITALQNTNPSDSKDPVIIEADSVNVVQEAESSVLLPDESTGSEKQIGRKYRHDLSLSKMSSLDSPLKYGDRELNDTSVQNPGETIQDGNNKHGKLYGNEQTSGTKRGAQPVTERFVIVNNTTNTNTNLQSQDNSNQPLGQNSTHDSSGGTSFSSSDSMLFPSNSLSGQEAVYSGSAEVQGAGTFKIAYTGTEGRAVFSRPFAEYDDRKMVQNIVHYARFLVQKGLSSAVISLEPPSLGKMKLDIITENSKVTGKITVESHEIKELVQNSLPKLMDSMAQNGLKVESFDVEVGHNSGTDTWAEQKEMQSLSEINQSGYYGQRNAGRLQVDESPVHVSVSSPYSELFDVFM